MPLPQYSPVKVERLICYNCGSELRPQIKKTEQGKVQGISHVCIACEYVHEPSLAYSNGQQRPAKPEEVEAASRARWEEERRKVNAG